MLLAMKAWKSKRFANNSVRGEFRILVMIEARLSLVEIEQILWTYRSC